MADQDSDDLVLRIREIDNGFLLLGRVLGERLPTKFFPDLDSVEKSLIAQIYVHFEEPNDDEEEDDDGEEDDE